MENPYIFAKEFKNISKIHSFKNRLNSIMNKEISKGILRTRNNNSQYTVCPNKTSDVRIQSIEDYIDYLILKNFSNIF